MRRAFYALPVLTMVVVAVAVLVLGAARPYLVARVYGGPTEDRAALALRLVLSRREAGIERPFGPAPIRLTGRTDTGAPLAWRGQVDARGVAEIVLKGRVDHELELRLWTGSSPEPLVEGRLALARGAWLGRAESLGGSIAGSQSGELAVDVAPARGAFAIGFSDPLLIQVHRAGSALPSAIVEVEAGGALINDSLRPISAATNRNARLLVNLTPQEPVVMVTVRARARAGTGSWHGRVPVLQGALHAQRVKSVLLLESPVAGRDAFVSFVDRSGRLAGALPELRPDGKGGAHAIVPLPPDRGAPIWAVVSSDPDGQSPATVGWPLADPERLLGERTELPDTAFAWTASDVLLLDGAPAAVQREHDRRKRARNLAVAMSVVSFLLIGALVSYDVHRSRLPKLLGDALAEDGPPAQNPFSAPLWLAVALLCFALGFAVVALVAFFRLA